MLNFKEETKQWGTVQKLVSNLAFSLCSGSQFVVDSAGLSLNYITISKPYVHHCRRRWGSHKRMLLVRQ